MSMSGITVDPEVAEIWNEIKLRHTHRFIVFTIQEKKKVIIEEKGERVCTFDDFIACISKRHSAYGIYDFELVSPEGREIKKLAFVFWCPDTAPVGVKMIYASTKDTIKKSFSGLGLEFQANDLSDLDYKMLCEEVIRKA